MTTTRPGQPTQPGQPGAYNAAGDPTIPTATRIEIGSQDTVQGQIFLTPTGGVDFSGDVDALRDFYEQISHMGLYRDLTNAQRLGQMAQLMTGYYTWARDISANA